MSTPRKKFKIYQEEAKTRQTTHWDLDYMTDAQIDALMKAGAQAQKESQQQRAATPSVRLTLYVGVTLAVLVITGVFVLTL